MATYTIPYPDNVIKTIDSENGQYKITFRNITPAGGYIETWRKTQAEAENITFDDVFDGTFPWPAIIDPVDAVIKTASKLKADTDTEAERFIKDHIIIGHI